MYTFNKYLVCTKHTEGTGFNTPFQLLGTCSHYDSHTLLFPNGHQSFNAHRFMITL